MKEPAQPHRNMRNSSPSQNKETQKKTLADVRARNYGFQMKICCSLSIFLLFSLIVRDWKSVEFFQLPTSIDSKKNSISTTATVAVPSKETKATMKNEVSAQSFATTVSTYDNKNEYPLKSLGILSAEHAYQRGFWQRTKPYPLHSFWNDTICRTATSSQHAMSIPDWQRHVPHVLIIGSQKGGTTAMAYYLYNHPSIPYLPSKELNFYDNLMDQLPLADEMNDGPEILEAYRTRAVSKEFSLERLQKEGNLRILDATPNYLFVSDRAPTRILCSCGPWIKLLTLLRNPVDRAWSQYHMQYNHDISSSASALNATNFLSFEEYIDLDLRVLQETGVILGDDSDLSFEKYSGSYEEFQAWKIYTRLGINSPLGRGLYSIQLRHWFQAMEKFNKPKADLMVIQTEKMKQNSSATYEQVLKFLKLPDHKLKRYDVIHKTKYNSQITPQMKPETRKRLQDFYRPFNQQLVNLLGSEWKGVWEDEGRT